MIEAGACKGRSGCLQGLTVCLSNSTSDIFAFLHGAYVLRKSKQKGQGVQKSFQGLAAIAALSRGHTQRSFE